MSLYAYGNTTNGGLRRNEDAYYIGDIGDYLLLAVVDGNGGADGMVNIGSIVTTLTKDFFARLIKTTTALQDIRNQMDSYFYMLSRAFLTVNAIDERYSNITASVSILIVEKISLQGIVASIGSTEVQLIRTHQFRRLNELHTEAFRLLQQGEISEEELYTHPQRAILTSALGVFESITYDIQNIQLVKDDIVLLTTDGLYRVTTPEGVILDLVDMAGNDASIADSVDAILKKANSYECNDNCTLLVLYVPDDNSASAMQKSERLQHDLHPISSIRQPEGPRASQEKQIPRNTIGFSKQQASKKSSIQKNRQSMFQKEGAHSSIEREYNPYKK